MVRRSAARARQVDRSGCPESLIQSRALTYRRICSPYESPRIKSVAVSPSATSKGVRRAKKRDRVEEEISVRSMLPWGPKSEEKTGIPIRLLGRDGDMDLGLQDTGRGLGMEACNMHGRSTSPWNGTPGIDGCSLRHSPGDHSSSRSTEGNNLQVHHEDLFRSQLPHFPGIDDYIRSPSLTFGAITKRGHTDALPITGGANLLDSMSAADVPWREPDEESFECDLDSENMSFSDEHIDQVCGYSNHGYRS